MPPPIQRLAERYMIEAELIQVQSRTLTVETIRQIVVDVEPKEKLDTLIALLERERPTAALVFRKRKVGVDELHRQLRDRGVEVSALHGGMTQGQRDSVMLRFRAGRARILIATNVAARGLDISHVSHVISYDVPDDPEEYTHRIGRTGRVGRSGIAFTFAGRRDAKGVTEIERVTGATIEHISGERIRAGVPGVAVEKAVAETPAPAEPKAPVEAPIPSAPAAEAVEAAPEPIKDDGVQGVRLFVGAGRRHGVQRDPLVELFRDQGGVEPLRARVHHAFSFVDVAPDEAEAVVERLAGAELGGRALKVQVAERQPAAA